MKINILAGGKMVSTTAIKDINNYSNINNSIRKKMFTCMVSGRIFSYINRFIDTLNNFKKEDFEIDDIYYQKVIKLSDLVTMDLTINDEQTYSKMLASINIANLLLNNGIENKDFDSILTSFYDLKRDLIELELIKEMEKI